jgi:hypothetical protein
VREMLSPIANMARHDPAVIVGLLFIAGAAVLYFHIQLKLVRAEYPMRANPWETPRQYLKARAKHGWPSWPAYLLGPCVLFGIALLVFGLFRL